MRNNYFVKMKTIYLLGFAFLLFFSACSGEENQKKATAFLSEYNQKFQELLYASAEAEWKSNTHIIEGDSSNAIATRKANEAFAAFQGSKNVIETCRKLLANERELLPLQTRQLKKILYMAAANPAIVDSLVKLKIKTQTEQTEKLFGYTYTIGKDNVTPNQIDKILKEEKNPEKRLAAWKASKEGGKGLKKGLSELRDLRNQTVHALDYPDFFTYQVSDYGMKTEELMDMTGSMVKDVWPLYREMHTWARYTLAKKYNQPVPEMLPAHWLPNRWRSAGGSEFR